MENLKIYRNKIIYSRENEIVRITAVSKNAIRFESTKNNELNDDNYSLMPKETEAKITEDERYVDFLCGTLRLRMYRDAKVFFYKNENKILEEQPELTFDDGIRNYHNKESGLYKTRLTFKPNDNEHFYGLGHEATNLFDLKGSSFDIRNVNAKCTIPFIYSSLGYGFLWNVPSTGAVELSNNRTRWTSDCTKKIDYVVIGGNPKEVASTLSDLTGHAPIMPHWATGFWQSRLRYETQEELLDVARRYKEENIPLSAIIADYFHWQEQGDWKFDKKYWHDVKAMTDELHEMGTRLIVSVWPTINENSENYSHMVKNNLLIKTKLGSNKVFPFYGPQAEIDATNPQTREFVWSKLKENYIYNGVDGLWFDEAEPEIHPEHFDNLIFHLGNGDEVALLYPYYYTKMAYDGFKSIGREKDVCTLSRCAYFGSQKNATLVWSGDIKSTFESLSQQVKSGLNMAMCGIPWWNTDIGGFYGGDTTTDEYKELIVRWFQYGLFCPVMRVHGNRVRHGERHNLKEPTGDPNELWSFGERNFGILKDLVFLRERLRPYIEEQLEIASKKGYPIMRPMFFEYPDDKICYETGLQYMFGDKILFAPIVDKGQTKKQVYLPNGNWTLTKTKENYLGGKWYTIDANIDEFVAFVKDNDKIIELF